MNKKEIPNKTTIEALKEMKKMQNNPKKYKRYKNTNEIMDDLLSK